MAKKRKSKRKNPSHKKTTKVINIGSGYVPCENMEPDIPFNIYIPDPLPVPKHIANATNIIQYYTLAQTETNDEFIASVKHKPTGYEILVGGKEMHGCIIITIQKVEWFNPNSLTEATINVKYHEDCNITHDLLRGVGTITLMRTAISFAFMHFKIDKFKLKDMSRFTCFGIYEISLPALYILKYGQSWYQKHLGARIYHARLQSNLDEYKRFVATKPDWDYLYSSYILPELQLYEELSDNKQDTRKHIQETRGFLYDSWKRTGSYRDFILDIIADDKRCSYLMNWFSRLFHDIVNQGLYDNVENFLLYDEFPFIGGLSVSHIKTTYRKETETGIIHTLHQNEGFTMDGGMRQQDRNVRFLHDPFMYYW